MRMEELSRSQPFLLTTDSLSEAEVLDIVHNLNENIFQVAANLAEEWEKLQSRFCLSEICFDFILHSYGHALAHRALHRDAAAITFLIQTCLCHLVGNITSSWRCHQQGESKESEMLASVYERLSASGKFIDNMCK